MENNIKLIAQDFNIYKGDKLHAGARTGSISIEHLLTAGAQGVILGHSEIGDDLETVNNKLKTIIHNKIIKKTPENFALCILIGESWEEFEGKSINEIANDVQKKCKIIFKNIPENFLRNAIIGYEPKWGSRGSGRDDQPPPSPELISACVKSLKDYISECYPNMSPFYIYGGRSTPERTVEILSDDNIDGLILGSACNTVEKTIAIVNSMQETKDDKNKVIICNFKAYVLPDPYEKYVKEFQNLPGDFFIYLAPAYTDIRLVKQLI